MNLDPQDIWDIIDAHCELLGGQFAYQQLVENGSAKDFHAISFDSRSGSVLLFTWPVSTGSIRYHVSIYNDVAGVVQIETANRINSSLLGYTESGGSVTVRLYEDD